MISEVFGVSSVFRIGGDEFLMVLQGSALEDSDELLARLESKCATTFIGESCETPISIAVGFAKFDPSKDLRFEDVFKRADYEMYANKRKLKKGRNSEE